MRFLYGVILGVLASVIAAILYLALGGGEYLLVLSPTFHEMKSRIGELERAEKQRDQLTVRLEQLARALEDLERRFGEVSQRAGDHPATSPPASPPPEAPAEAGGPAP